MVNYTHCLFSCFLTLLWVITACTNHHSQDYETEQMVKYLASKRDSAKRTSYYPYYTEKMLEELKRSYETSKGLSNLSPSMTSSKVLDYSLVLVLNGKNELAKETITHYLESINQMEEVNAFNANFFRVLGLASIREAEQQNCIHHHGSNSCIVPLEGDGVHGFPEPAENAKKFYEKLLQFKANDYQSLWFYNIACMALGEYPNQMNSKYVIPLKDGVDKTFPRFENVAMFTGAAINNHAGGSAILDVNNDGLNDIFTSSYGLSDPSQLLINNEDGRFRNVSKTAGIDGLVGGLNHIHGDFNNDGHIDIFIARGAWLSTNGHIANSLLINQGNGTFVDRTESSGLLSFYPTGAVATADIDLDGDLDLFVGNESTKDRNPSELFINDGKGNFRNQAKELGLECFSFVKGAVWGDVNGDKYPDLFVSNYGEDNVLYLNTSIETAKLSFRKSAQNLIQQPQYSFTCWMWDYDQDGDEDIFVSGYDNRQAHLISDEYVKELKGEDNNKAYPRLFSNDGSGTFEDITKQTKLDKLLYTMGGNYGDFNNDGYPDFYVGTGEFNIWATIPNRMFMNVNGEYFEEVTFRGGFGQIQKGHGVAFGDLDNDGDVDIYHQVGGAVESDVFHNMLYENPGFDSSWLKLKLQGTKANHSAIGAKIVVHTNNRSNNLSFHTVGTGGSFGANSLDALIGLGNASAIDSVSIFWPRKGTEPEVFNNFELNNTYKIVEGRVGAQKLTLPSIKLGGERKEHMH